MPVERSRAEIERLLVRYGASAFVHGWRESRVLLQFEFRRRAIQFEMEMPDRSAREFTRTGVRGSRRSGAAASRSWEQACRQRWRALALVLKAKLEAVEAGICTFEQEFLPWTVLPNGRTIAQEIEPQVQRWIEGGAIPKLLAAPEGA